MIEYILFILGILFLVKGANYLVEGSSLLAKKIKIPSLIIGLTIVAFGTSLPELIINIFSALKGSTDVAFGNIVGSNIANILLVLGAIAIISPIKVEKSTIWKEIPFALLAVIVLFIASNHLFLDKLQIDFLTKVSGAILLSFFIIFLYYTFEMTRKSREKIKLENVGIDESKKSKIFFFILIGLIALYFGGDWVVNGAVYISKKLGLSMFLISATIIAIGTSLPELVVGLTAARKKETELAVGNAVGSNIFNIFWILGVTTLIAPIYIPEFINFDLIFLICATFLLFLFLFIGKKHELERWQGILFILLYIVYISYIALRG